MSAIQSPRDDLPDIARRRPGRRTLWCSAASILAVLTMAASACSKTTDSGSSATTVAPVDREAAAGAPKAGGELSVGLAAETNSYNPFIGQWTASAYLVANTVFDPLAAFDPQGNPKPYLAESFTPSSDFLTWTIKLRPNIEFHNGEKLDAAALKKNFDALKAAIMGGQAYANIASTEVVDDLSVAVKMNKPWATFPSSLALQNGYVIAPAMIDDPAGADAKPIGTGPFQLQSWQRDSEMRLTKNPKYWRKDATGTQLPYLDAMRFKILTDATARRQALASGDVGAVQTADADSFAAAGEIARTGDAQLITNAATETDEAVLAFNTTREPFNDPIARQAMAVGLDQDQLATTAFANGAWPSAWGMFAEGSPYYISREEAGYPAHDLEKAKQLVKQYEQAHGKPLEFGFIVPASATSLTQAQALQAQLAEFGAKMNIESTDTAGVITKVVVAGDYDSAFFLIWSSPTPDQGYIFLALPPSPTGLSLNYTRFDDVELRNAMDTFRGSADEKVRIESFKTVQKELAKNLQLLFLVHERSGFLYANNLYGVGATRFPDANVVAYNPYITTPFFTTTWRRG